MKTIDDIQNEIVDEFMMFDDWMDRYEYIIETGKNVPELDKQYKIDEFLIPGCQSRVWFVPKFKDGKISFLVDSDAIITKGIAGLIQRVYNNRTPEEILNSELFFVENIGLKDNLSPTRANGLVSMLDKIQHYAKTFAKKGN